MFRQIIKNRISFLLLLFVFGVNFTAAQTNEFTYQGKLTEGGMAPSGNYDFEFRLYDAAAGGTLLGTQTRSGVPVSNGIFIVSLDFGAQFSGAARFLDISVKPAGSANPFSPLAPRQAITSSPYAIRSLSAGVATNSLQLGGVAANQFPLTTDARLSDARNPLAGSANYIQNTTSPQAASNFNVSGDGTVGGTLTGNLVRAGAQFNIGNDRVLSIGNLNTYVGKSAGQSNPTGTANTFVGNSAGANTTTGFRNSFFGSESGTLHATNCCNSFFGYAAGNKTTSGYNSFFGDSTGSANTSGANNSFFGASAGLANTTASENSFFGADAGAANTTGGRNSLFGRNSGLQNTTGNANSFFGSDAGRSNTTGNTNSFFGSFAGRWNTSGFQNSFFGGNAGFINTTGSNNSFFGHNAGQQNIEGNSNSFFGRDAGNGNTTGSDNSFFGSGAGSDNTTGRTNSFFGVVAGVKNTTGDFNAFFGRGAGFNNLDGNENTFVGANSGIGNTNGQENSFLGYNSGGINTTGNGNVMLGFSAGNTNTVGSNNTIIGKDADVSANNLSFGTAIGSGSVVSASNTIALGRTSGADRVRIYGRLAINTLGAATATNLCINTLTDDVAACSSSLRYKTNIATFTTGLSFVNRLRPVTFNWKESSENDLGLIAEEVAEVEPLLVTRNKTGEIQGVKYDRISVVLLNAVKEQQTQIQEQQRQIAQLKQIVCTLKPNTEICKETNK